MKEEETDEPAFRAPPSSAREIASPAWEGGRTSGVIPWPSAPTQIAETVSSASGLCCMSA